MFISNAYAEAVPPVHEVSFVSFFPMIVLSIYFGFLANKLAKEKGRDEKLWTILGLLPLVNMFSIWFFMGASNLKLERKLDEVINRLDTIDRNKLGV